jgi:hypothetical protein
VARRWKGLPDELGHVENDLEAAALTRPHFARERAEDIVQPAVAIIVGLVGEAADELPHPVLRGSRVALPGKRDRRAVVGFHDAPELGQQGTVDTPPRIVGAAVAARETPVAAPLGNQEALPLYSPGPEISTLQASGVVKITR